MSYMVRLFEIIGAIYSYYQRLLLSYIAEFRDIAFSQYTQDILISYTQIIWTQNITKESTFNIYLSFLSISHQSPLSYSQYWQAEHWCLKNELE